MFSLMVAILISWFPNWFVFGRGKWEMSAVIWYVLINNFGELKSGMFIDRVGLKKMKIWRHETDIIVGIDILSYIRRKFQLNQSRWAWLLNRIYRS